MYRKSLFPLIFIGLFCLSTISQASQVIIPDSYFRNFLKEKFPTCMTGDVLETTCSEIVNATTLDVSNRNIADLSGIQYFTNLKTLNCGGNYQMILPSSLPTGLIELDCRSNNQPNLPTLPVGLTKLNCDGNKITSLPQLPSGLIELSCGSNQLTSLPSLPASLTKLYCSSNSITALAALPASLQYLEFSNNQIALCPSLPSGIVEINCSGNSLSSLPVLPTNLTMLNCSFNVLTSLPTLPNSISNLYCDNNLLTSLPSLPTSLTSINCADNMLLALPIFPSMLTTINCDRNQLTSLPPLSNGLTDLSCNSNQLRSLPTLPSAIISINCQNNKITAIPHLPDDFVYIYYSGNPTTCLPNMPANRTSVWTDIHAFCSTTTSISSSSFCQEEQVNISFTVSNDITFNTNNIFTAHIINTADPNFTPISIGTKQGQSAANMTVTIPKLTPGNTYRIRVISSEPETTGSDNASDLIIKPSSIQLTSSSNSFCAGNSTTLTAAGGSSYSWETSSDLVVNSVNTALATASPSVSKSFTVSGISTNGCLNTATISITVNLLPAITITPAISVICKGAPLTMNANGAASYTWTATGFSSIGNSVTVNPTSDITYTISGTSVEGCSSTVSKDISISQVAVPIVTSDCNRLATTASNLTYQWNINSNPISDATSNSFQPTECGLYNLTVTNNLGCKESSSPIQVMTINPTFTAIANSNANVDQSLISYPNPFSGTFKVQAVAKLIIVDMTGKIVFEKQVTDLSEEQEIDLSNQASGIYIAQLIMGNTIVSRKTIVQK